MAFLGYPCTEGDKEAMLKRKIENYLQEHYSTDEKALLITGARQTGKTFSIREFGKTFKRSPDYNLPEAFIFCNDNIRRCDKLTYAPIYMVMFLQRKNDAPSYYKIDLSGLT